MTVVIDKWN